MVLWKWEIEVPNDGPCQAKLFDSEGQQVGFGRGGDVAAAMTAASINAGTPALYRLEEPF